MSWGIYAGLSAVAAATYLGAMGLGAATLRRDPTIGKLDAYLPFSALTERGVTVQRGGEVRVYRMGGVAETTLSIAEQEANAKRRGAAIAHLLDAGLTVRLHAVRDPAALHEHVSFPSPFLDQVHTAWMKQFERIFVTRRYITIEGSSQMPAWRLNDLCAQAIDARLGAFDPEPIVGRELMAFWGSRLDPVFGGVEPTNVTSLAAALAPSEVAADRTTGIVTVRHGLEALSAQQVTIQEWSENDGPMIVDGLLELPVRLEVTLLLKPIPRVTVMDWLERKRRQETAQRENKLVNEELSDVADLLQSGRDIACKAQMSVTVIAEPENLADAVGQVYGHLSSQGIKPVVEHGAAGYLWLSRMPGQTMMVRGRPLRASNIGSLWRWSQHPEGFERSDWGHGSVRLFKALGDTAYRFQWHISPHEQDIGHTVVFAPSRVGKTTSLLHLTGGSLRHDNLRAYIFDRNLSTRVWVEAAGGAYFNPHDTEQMKLNFLQGANTREERDFVHAMLQQLSGMDDADTKNQISLAVQDIFSLPAEKRRFSELWQTAFRPGTLKDALRRWADLQDVGALLSAPRDTLSFKNQRIVAFDYTQLFRDPSQAAAVTMYLMHRIRQMSVEDASPHLIYMEEVAPMLADPVFGPAVQVILREHAKLRGVCVLVFQDVGAALNGPIGETILTNCRRRLIFPNPAAREEEYAALSLTDEEWAFVKGDHLANQRMARPLLSWTEHESVFLDMDLTPLGELLPFYRGGSEPTMKMQKMKAKWGERWKEYYN